MDCLCDCHCILQVAGSLCCQLLVVWCSVCASTDSWQMSVALKAWCWCTLFSVSNWQLASPLSSSSSSSLCFWCSCFCARFKVRCTLPTQFLQLCIQHVNWHTEWCSFMIKGSSCNTHEPIWIPWTMFSSVFLWPGWHLVWHTVEQRVFNVFDVFAILSHAVCLLLSLDGYVLGSDGHRFHGFSGTNLAFVMPVHLTPHN